MTKPEVNYAIISSLNLNAFQDLTREQETTLETLRQWVHQYNLGEAPEPDFDDNISELVSAYAEMKMAQDILE